MTDLRVLGLLGVWVFALSGCGDGDNPPTKASAAVGNFASAESNYALKVFVAKDGKTERLVNVRPAAAVGPNFAATAAPKQGTQSLERPSDKVEAPTSADDDENIGRVQQYATVKKGDGSTETTDNDVVPGWTLLKWAVASCGSPVIDNLSTPMDEVHLVDPWTAGDSNTDTWYVFQGLRSQDLSSLFPSCDAVLYREEQLLCAADRLAQIGDSAGTVYWDSFDNYHYDSETQTWIADAVKLTIPPQATKDKFIARDLALNVLGHLGRLTARQQHVRVDGSSYEDRTCAEWYGDVASSGDARSSDIYEIYRLGTNAVFSSPFRFASDSYFGDNLVELTADENKRRARTRVSRLANLMGGASRLTRDLVERTVKDDMAGAQKAFAATGDRRASALKAWGVDAGQEPYNNLRHVLKTLYGRLELGPNTENLVWDPHGATLDDPRCYKITTGSRYRLNGGVAAADLLPNVGFGFDARWDDITPNSRGETLAVSILGSAGIVFATSQEVDATTARDAVAEQLVLRGAKLANLTEAEFRSQSKSMVDAILASVNEAAISDAELKFGMQRVYDAFRVLAFADDVRATDAAGYSAALRVAATAANVPLLPSEQASDIEAAGGVVLDGSLPRTVLGEDLTARLYSPRYKSNCGVNPLGASTASRRTYALGPNVGEGIALQNVFVLGDTFRRQMNHLNDLLSSNDGELAKAKSFLAAVSAETRQWSGKGMIVREFDAAASVDRYYLIDIAPADLGLADDDELTRRLTTVYAGAPALVDCVAGTRPLELCPANLAAGGIPNVFDHANDAVITHNTNYAGAETYIRSIEFPHSSLGRALVLRSENGRPGRVLTIFRGTSLNGEMFAEPLSDWQSELTARAFGVGHEATPERTCSGTPPLSQPGRYCIDGMDRDQFVPLANELTSSGGTAEDSWRHYLDVADAAATKADELAKEMIQTGLTADIRKETAAESIAEICGSFPHDSGSVSATGGAVTVKDDSAIASCLNPDTVDIVFLSKDPLSDARGDTATIVKQNKALCDIYCSPGSPTMPWCSSKCVATNTDPDHIDPAKIHEITHAGLGIAEEGPHFDDAPDPLTPCMNLLDTLSSDNNLDTAAFSSAARAGWISEAAMMAASNSLSLVENSDRSWSVKVGDKIIVQSSPSGTLTYPDMDTATFKYYVRDSLGHRVVQTKDGLPKRMFPAGSASNGNAATRENAELAMFYLGALAGGIPAGRIVLPVPAVNLTVLNGAPVPTVDPIAYYSAGNFTLGQDNVWRFLGAGHNGYMPLSLADETLEIPAGTSPAQFFGDRSGAHPELPGTAWRAKLYADAAAAAADTYLALPTSNAAITYGSSLNGDGDPSVGTVDSNDNNGRAFLNGWLDEVARDYASHYHDATDLATSQSTAQKIQRSAWHDMSLRTVANYERAVCQHAFVHPVFGKGLGERMGSLGDLGTDRDGGVVSFIAASPTGSRAFDMMNVVGRDGGPATSGLYPQTNIDGSHPPVVRQDRWLQPPTPSDFWGIAHDRLLPTQCPPAERLELFMRTELGSNVEAMQTLMRSLTLACIASQQQNYGAILSKAPGTLKSVDDLRQLENWLTLFGYAAKRVSGNLFLVGVPVASLPTLQAGTVGVSAISQGEQGKLLLELEENIRKVGGAYADIGALFEVLTAEIRVARLQIQAANLSDQSQDLKFALQAIDVHRQLALTQADDARKNAKKTFALLSAGADILGGASGMATAQTDSNAGLQQRDAGYRQMGSGVDGLVGVGEESILNADIPSDAEIQQDYANQITSNLSAQADLGKQITSNAIAQILGNLSSKLPSIFTGVGDHLTELKNSLSDAEQNIIDLKGNQSKAAIAVAKAQGADFVEVNGQTVPLHVNTVYRRQFDVLKQRYETALQGAKRAAYLARLAIEERIGVRLTDLQSPIGPLEAPNLWADDLCTVQGVDYSKLRSATPEQDQTGAAEVDKIAGFADQYVGDYVAKLREFVDFYNLENPFKESRDTAILSLRESLGDADGRCIAPSQNMLFYSDQLDMRPPNGAADPTAAVGGWTVSGCTKSACLNAQSGLALGALVAPSGPGGATWLSSVTKDANWQVSVSEVPPGIVYQSVQLRAGGSYVLSWWDQARKDTGEAVAANATVPLYPVRVYDSGWHVVASDYFAPATSAWSERRSLVVEAPADGIYHVGFAAADPDVAGANLAISNVQLEGGQSAVTATAYQRTDASRTTFSSNCKVDDPEGFRERFDYKCESTGCFYELRDLLRLDTQLLQQGYSPLTGKVAGGNYNYRLDTVAVNLVGTGLVDCAQSGIPSCYTSGYVEYDLSHQAQNVPMEDYAGKTRCFDFAVGAVNGGKALATERTLSLPLSSADADLVNQPAISKQELVGRPLSGTYKLRIREQPGFVWQHVEDIQLLVNYQYWSRVSKSAP